MEWVASNLHINTEHGVSSVTTADAHTLGCQESTELRRPPFRRKTKSGFCACVIFQTQSTYEALSVRRQ